MSNEAKLIESARDFLDGKGIEQEVIAAGVFGLADDYKAIVAGSVVTSIVLPDTDSPLLAGVEGAATVAGAREVSAKEQGLSVRILVAVTADSIFLLSVGKLGSDPQRKLLEFERTSTEVEVHRFGLSKRVRLAERGGPNHVRLTGTTARFSAESAGDKAVLAELLS